MGARERRAVHHRARLRLLPHHRHLLLLLPLLLLFLLPPLSALLLRRANSLGRRCLPPAAEHRPLAGQRLSFSIVTLSDEDLSGRGVRGRSFRGVLAATARNKRAYAAAHGYGLAALPPGAVDPPPPPPGARSSPSAPTCTATTGSSGTTRTRWLPTLASRWRRFCSR
uniref:Uncharacterized protein n=1 Tax=Triticum urartu TaxID=4572 RepID=A0A8R7QUX2_TRIUA